LPFFVDLTHGHILFACHAFHVCLLFDMNTHRCIYIKEAQHASCFWYLYPLPLICSNLIFTIYVYFIIQQKFTIQSKSVLQAKYILIYTTEEINQDLRSHTFINYHLID